MPLILLDFKELKRTSSQKRAQPFREIRMLSPKGLTHILISILPGRLSKPILAGAGDWEVSHSG